ncbi:hypothetical protein DN069_13700 [Streptacidiphilus pinicola]|uniref:Uncharacterized protein n=1 Tax=Streptacidiphilus pinicola TaxID=2219663 RepID=A0A2X0INA4_9ACTN|nr:hypothetical protein [Streptacidiphilus pinicola]RAG85013.1 hypothetical protein DN069_13700 [Streptacidiphilus pinicola]
MRPTADLGTGRINVLVFPKLWSSLKPQISQGTTAISLACSTYAQTGQLPRIFETSSSPALTAHAVRPAHMSGPDHL